MQKLFFSIVLCFSFLFFSNSVFGQNDKKEKPIAPYDEKIGDWDIVIPIDSSLVFDDDIFIFIYVNGGPWRLPSEITERGVEMIHPSELFLWQKVEGENGAGEYDFQAIFFDPRYPFPYNIVHKTQSLSFSAPTLDLNLRWENMNYHLKAKTTIYFKNLDDFEINEEESYFYTIDVLSDSIIKGSEKKFPVNYRNYEFSGEKTMERDQIAIDKQYVAFSLRLDNDDGQAKLYGHVLSTFFVEGTTIVTNNPTGRGAVTFHSYDNQPRNAIVSNCMNFIETTVIQSGEPYWLPNNTPSGLCLIFMEGFTTAKIVKY
jgi:hypothetical protein